MTRPRGRLWHIDDGFICNDADSAHVAPPFDAAVRAAIDAYKTHIPSDVHSIYVTGSVPRGRALPGESDLDMIAVLEIDTDPELVKQDWLDEAEVALAAAHDCISDVQLELWPYGYVFLDPDEFSIGALILKTHSVCVWGPDLAPSLPDYRADRHTLTAIANDDVVQIRPDIEEAVAEIDADPVPETVRYWCRRISKNILRAGFGLVMPAEGVFTRDLDLAYSYFARHYPGRAKAMQRALAFAEVPTADAGTVRAYLGDFGAWLIDEADRWLDEHNPERDLALRCPQEAS